MKKRQKTFWKKGYLPVARALCNVPRVCTFALWRSKCQRYKTGFFGQQTPGFKQPDGKHDQGSCAFELTHTRKAVMTQQSVVLAGHTLLK